MGKDVGRFLFSCSWWSKEAPSSEPLLLELPLKSPPPPFHRYMFLKPGHKHEGGGGRPQRACVRKGSPEWREAVRGWVWAGAQRGVPQAKPLAAAAKAGASTERPREERRAGPGLEDPSLTQTRGQSRAVPPRRQQSGQVPGEHTASEGEWARGALGMDISICASCQRPCSLPNYSNNS